MPLHFTFRRLPELANLSHKERRRVLKTCWRKPFTHAKTWCYLIPLWAFGAFLSAVPFIAIQWRLTTNFSLLIAITISTNVYWVVSSLFFKAFILIPAIRPYLREQLSGFCTHCGYDLRASPSRCPECGTLVPSPTNLV